MLKERIRKWLGIWDLDNKVLAQHDRLNSHENAFARAGEDIRELEHAYDRLKNMYDSNRMRIDTLTGRLDKTDALVAQLRLIGLPTSVLKAPKRERPKKPTTTKKGK